MIFGTQEWFDEYKKRLNGNEEFKKAGKDWGVGWNGDFIFQIDDIPLELLEKLPADLPEDLKIAKEKIVNLLKEYGHGKTLYAFIGLKDGACTAAHPIKNPDEVDVGFVLSGPYDQWKKLAKAETDATKLILTRKMKLKGKMSTIMRYIKATVMMGKIASEVPTEFPDEMALEFLGQK